MKCTYGIALLHQPLTTVYDVGSEPFLPFHFAPLQTRLLFNWGDPPYLANHLSSQQSAK